MELNNIYDLINRFENSDLSEFEVELDNSRLYMKRGNKQVACQPVDKSAFETVQPQNTANPNTNSVEKGEPKAEATKEITAPLVGTFYTAASPDAEPFVKVGQTVKKGDVIGIIEAMKLMNEVTANEEGVVSEIVAENETLVEYGQVLVRLS